MDPVAAKAIVKRLAESGCIKDGADEAAVRVLTEPVRRLWNGEVHGGPTASEVVEANEGMERAGYTRREAPNGLDSRI